MADWEHDNDDDDDDNDDDDDGDDDDDDDNDGVAAVNACGDVGWPGQMYLLVG